MLAETVTYSADISENYGGPRNSGYHLQGFSVSTAGQYDMQVIAFSGAQDSYLHFYLGSYPGTLLASNDDSGPAFPLASRIISNLLAGTTYTLLTSTFGSGVTSTIYTNQISGPGTINLAGADLTVSLLQNPNNSPYDLSGGSETYANVTLLDGLIEDTVSGGLLTATTGFEVQSGTISANLAGGTLTKTTSGTVTLSGTNSYTGGTFLNGGILSVSTDGNLGNASGTLNFDAGTLQITGTDFTSTARTINWGSGGGGFDIADPGNNFTVSQTLSGTGALTKLGAGTLTLSGTNTYSGGTEIDGGTLAVSADNNLGTGNLSFDGGSLQFLASFDTSKNVTLNAGGGEFDTNGFDSTASGAITGTGALTKFGAGTLTLSGANAYTGLTSVDAGTLVVDGSLASDVQNSVNGTLMGNGNIGGTVTNDGIVAPGNSIGTLTVGDYVSNTGSSYEAEVDAAGNSDLIAATGTATLNGGTVDVLASGASTDYARQTTYTIVSADSGVAGTYEGVTINLAELSPTLNYADPNLVALLLTRTDINFGALAGNLTHNQESVANVLTTASLVLTSGDFSDVLNLYADDLTEEMRRAALDEMGGQKVHTAMSMAAFSLIEGFQGSVGSRMSRLHQANDGAVAKADPLDGVKLAMAGDVTDLGPLDKQGKKNRNLWAHAYAINGDVDADQNAAGYDFDVYGAAFGVDFPVAKGTNLGFTAGYGTGNVGTDRHDDADIDSVLVGIYGNYENGRFYLDGMVTYADNSYETDRNITVGPLTRKAEGDYDGSEWAFAAEMGYVGTVGDYTVQPFLGTRFIRLDEDGFTEKGAGDLNLKVDDRTAYSWKVYPGVKVNRAMKTGEKSLFVPEVSVKFVSELRDSYDKVNASFVGAPAAGSFSVDGIDIAKNSIEFGAGFKILDGNNFQVGLDFGTEINSARTSYLWNVGVKYLW